MTTRKQQTAARASKASKPAKAKGAALEHQTVERVATATVTAFLKAKKTEDGAQQTLLASVVAQAKAIGRAMSASEYDLTLGRAIAGRFAAAVQKGILTESTAASARSRIKTALLALMAGFAPKAGEGFRAFYDRAGADFILTAKIGGKPIWEAKAGKKRAAAGSKSGKAGSASGGPTASPQGPAGGEPEVTDANAFQRAALIVCKGSQARAAKLVIVMTSYRAEFDKWAETIIPAPEPRLAPNAKPDTAMAAALAKAQAKAS